MRQQVEYKEQTIKALDEAIRELSERKQWQNGRLRELSGERRLVEGTIKVHLAGESASIDADISRRETLIDAFRREKAVFRSRIKAKDETVIQLERINESKTETLRR